MFQVQILDVGNKTNFWYHLIS